MTPGFDVQLEDIIDYPHIQGDRTLAIRFPICFKSNRPRALNDPAGEADWRFSHVARAQDRYRAVSEDDPETLSRTLTVLRSCRWLEISDGRFRLPDLEMIEKLTGK